MPVNDSSLIPREFTPLSLLRMLWKQMPLMLGVWIAVTAGTVAVVYQLPTIYRAETVILVEAQSIPERLVQTTVETELQDRLSTIMQQILSSTQLMKVIEKNNLYRNQRATRPQEEIIEKMRQDIHVDIERGWSRSRPGAIRVSYKNSEPSLTATVTNEVGSLFIEQNLRQRELQAVGAEDFLKRQLDDARKRLQEQEAKMSEFKQRNSGQLPGQESAIMISLSRLQGDLQRIDESVTRSAQNIEMYESDLRSAEAALQRAQALAAMEQQAAAQSSTGTGGTGGSTPAEPPAPPKRSEALQQQIDQLKQRYSEQHPSVRYLRGELERVRQIEAQEARERAQKQQKEAAKEVPKDASPKDSGPKDSSKDPATPPAPAKPTARPNPQTVAAQEQQMERIQRLKAQITMANQEIAARQKEREKLSTELAGYQSRMASLPLREQEMIGVTRDYEMTKRSYDDLQGKMRSAEIGREMESLQKGERFTVLDAARIPERPFEPNRPLLNLAGCLSGLAIAIILGVLVELRKNVVLGEWELPSDVWVLGRIPVITLSEGGFGAPGEPRYALAGDTETGGSSGVKRVRPTMRWIVVSLVVALAAAGLALSYLMGWRSQ